MPTFIELMTTENVSEIRHLSLYITKAFGIIKIFFISIKYAPHAFMYIVDELICSCISIECILCVFIASIHRGLCSCCIMK